MTDATTFQQVQNGIDTGAPLQFDPPPRYMHDGRGLCSFTHVDVLFQSFFTAYLVLGTMGAPVNPGSPYAHAIKQNGFGTSGGPDFAATLATAARQALNSVWHQKWSIHLRHRPGSGGAIVRQILQGLGNTLDGHVHSNVLNSRAVQASFDKHGDYFLAQSFPEGSPTHSAYPTGHGAVAGACVTILKFFFDGDFVIPNPLVAANDGLSLVPYTGSDAGQLTRQRRAQQTGEQRLLRARHDRRHPLAQRHFLLGATGRGGRSQHVAGPGRDLCRQIHD